MEQSNDTVGVVGDIDDVAEALEAAGMSPAAGAAGPVLERNPAWVVAVGEDGLLELVDAGVDCPVLPVGAGAGVRSVPGEDAAAAVSSVLDGAATRADRTVLSVSLDGDHVADALFDVMAVTAEAARISEYSLRGDGEQVARVRADGLVVATPAGSLDYARDAGGPVLAPGAGVLAAVPVAPFVTDADHWVVDDAALELGVEREEPVSLVVDGGERTAVPRDATVTVGAGGRVSLLVVPESQSFFGGGRELEKH